MTSEIPKNCINCEFKSKSGRCYKYVNPNDTGARECYKVIKECKEHEAYQRQFRYGGPGMCSRDPMGYES